MLESPERINSVHPEMAIFTDFGVGLKFNPRNTIMYSCG